MTIRNRIGAHRRWSRATPEERSAGTAKARAAFDAKFEEYPNPASAKRAYFLALGEKRKGRTTRTNKRVAPRGSISDLVAEPPVKEEFNDGIKRVTLNRYGYRVITFGTGARMLEHRFLMEQKLERRLFPEESVHHINGVRDDNRIENLELWSHSHPFGQRTSDKLEWAKQIISQYGGIHQ